MPNAVAAMQRHRLPRDHGLDFLRARGVEKQQHVPPAPEKRVPALHARVKFKPKHVAIKRLGGVEVWRVQARFEDAVEFHPSLQFWSDCFSRRACPAAK
jgi:hypothetical protein